MTSFSQLRTAVLAVVSCLSLSCGEGGSGVAPAAPEVAEVAAVQPSDAPTFTYSLQASHLATSREAAAEAFRDCDRDWLIIDYSFHGDLETRWTAEEVGEIRAGRPGRKVFAYLSIGEAGTYRGYWEEGWDPDADGEPAEAAPAWLLSANPNWPDNYRVRYWDPAWREIMRSYLDDILAAGFDGMWFDTISSFEEFEHDASTDQWIDDRPNPDTGNTYREDMIALAMDLIGHARETAPDFLVVPNNAEQLLDTPDYAAAISGQGLENIFTDGNRVLKEDEVSWRLGQMAPARELGHPFFLVEYGTDEKARESSRAGAAAAGFRLLLTDLTLKTLGEIAE